MEVYPRVVFSLNQYSMYQTDYYYFLKTSRCVTTARFSYISLIFFLTLEKRRDVRYVLNVSEFQIRIERVEISYTIITYLMHISLVQSDV